MRRSLPETLNASNSNSQERQDDVIDSCTTLASVLYSTEPTALASIFSLKHLRDLPAMATSVQPTRRQLEASFREVVQGFEANLNELKRVALLRLEDSAKALFEQDTRTLLRSVCALEEKLREIRHAVVREKQAIDRMEKTLEQCNLQTLHLNFVNQNFPGGFPHQPLPHSNQASHQADKLGNGSKEALSSAAPETSATEGEADTSHAAEKKKRRAAHAERRYVSEQEFGQLSTYMTQRLPLSKVNTAVEEAADLADSNMRMLALARAGGKMATQEFKRAQSLLMHVANKDAVKGKCWFTEADLRKAGILRPDKTSKALLTILRHLGRIHEARLLVDGKQESIYVIIPETN